MRLLPVFVLLVALLGCGAGGASDMSKDNSVDNGPVIESNYRNVVLEWLPNSESTLAGYRVFMREDGKDYDYSSPEWETVDTDCELYNLSSYITYHFVVRAFDTAGDESGDSNEVTLNPM